MIKTIIIEDEPKATALLKEMLREIEPEISVVDHCEDLQSAIRSIRKHDPQLVFLDIELPVYNGLQLLEFLNPEEINFRIIFTTASNQHALRAFDMSAVDYILKPLQFEKLKTAIQKFNASRSSDNNYPYTVLKDNFFHTGSRKIIAPVSDGFELIKLEDILYIKAEGSYANIYRQDGGALLISHNLKYFENMLSGETQFIRIHRSYLVNIHFAKRISRGDGVVLVLENNTELPVTGDKVELILNYFKFQKL
jgi:two-component system LytT family response regulator